MKKVAVISAVALLVVMLSASFALAADQQPESNSPMTYGQMLQYHQQMLDQSVKAGYLTPEQAKLMNDHMSSMGSMMGGYMMNGSMMGGMMMGGYGDGVMGGPGLWHNHN